MYQKFRNNLRLLRAERNFTANELSLYLGWQKARVSFLENEINERYPTVEELNQLSEFFGVTLDQLFHQTAYVAFN